MKEKKEKKVIYISSMGGHLKELLALKKSMKKLYPKADYYGGIF